MGGSQIEFFPCINTGQRFELARTPQREDMAKAAPATIKARSGGPPREVAVSRIPLSRVGRSEISDAAYDKMWRRLKEIEAGASPVGDARLADGTRWAQNREKDLPRSSMPADASLDNAFSFDALRDFDRRVREGIGARKLSTLRNISSMD